MTKPKSSTKETEIKKCFVIMPIADHDGYDKGHFSRVYEYLIKPACKSHGFDCLLASDEKKSNFIMMDILRKILDSDLIICDLSARNPNVYYELGIAHAFNKKIVMIKDLKTTEPFDISGIRYCEYDQTLRVDLLNSAIDRLADMIISTSEMPKGEMNSVLSVLGRRPAELGEITQLDESTSLILTEISSIKNALKSFPTQNLSNNGTFIGDKIKSGYYGPSSMTFVAEPPEHSAITLKLGDYLYYGPKDNPKELGTLVLIDGDNEKLLILNQNKYIIQKSTSDVRKLSIRTTL